MKTKYIKYRKGQKVTPPDDNNKVEWWYDRDDPTGDWFNSLEEAEKSK